MQPSARVIAERRRQAAFGDFQTPPELAELVCRTLADQNPATIVEPTCGSGAFLAAAISRFPRAKCALAMDINPRHVAIARLHADRIASSVQISVCVADFFQTDWEHVLGRCEEPILILGNPPWVTSSALGVLASDNRPRKENFKGYSGLDALTGKSNFDVSEWMLIRLLDAACGRRATLAMLCKVAVARKVLLHAWKNQLPIESSTVHRIDALTHFGARVDACLFVCRLSARPATTTADCRVFRDLEGLQPDGRFGLRDGRLVADVSVYERVRHLARGGHRWRSGVKHDCAAVFELSRSGSRWRNGFGQRVDLEPDYVFPLLKGGQVANGDVASPARGILIPQRRIGEETSSIAQRAPQTWQYLVRHGKLLDRRASSVYRNHPRFSVFGVGPYTFSPWKVAVSGLSKDWRFAAVGPCRGRPVICDDTCYVLPCRSRREAKTRAELLNGDRAREFFSAFVFVDSKRPLTAEILGMLDLDRLADEARNAHSGGEAGPRLKVIPNGSRT